MIRYAQSIAIALALCAVSPLTLSAAEVNAEATRDAGSDYASAIRIRIRDAIDKPNGKSAQWRGILKAGDKIDAYKFTPTPTRGHMLILGIQGTDGPVAARFVDRKSGETMAETKDTDGVHTMALLVHDPVMLVVDRMEGDPDRPYSATVILTRPEEMGIVTPDAATKAFQAAMKRKPKMTPPPEGFSLIIPPKDGSD